jgi:hypothetical protein
MATAVKSCGSARGRLGADPVTASSDVGNKLVINHIRAGLAFKLGGGS